MPSCLLHLTHLAYSGHAWQAAVGIKAAFLRAGSWRKLLSRVPQGVRACVQELVWLLPSDVRPTIPWQTPAPSLQPSPDLVVLQGKKDRGLEERNTDALDALIACIYTGDEKGVEASLAAGADPVGVSSMWGTSALHVACSHALSPLALQSGLLFFWRRLGRHQRALLACCLVGVLRVSCGLLDAC